MQTNLSPTNENGELFQYPQARVFVLDYPANGRSPLHTDRRTRLSIVLSGRLRESANAHDSLGEAYLATGDRERAAAHYRQSLALDPDNDNARRALAELERD